MSSMVILKIQPDVKLPFPLIGSRDFSLFGALSLSVPGVALASGL